MTTDYAKPRSLFDDGTFSNDAENIAHLEACPGCEVCQYLIEFYQSCDNCGAFGHQRIMGGVVQYAAGIGTATVLCPACLDKHEEHPGSVYLVPPRAMGVSLASGAIESSKGGQA